MAPRIRVPANFGIEHINSPVHGNLLLKLKDGQVIRTNSMIMSLNSPVIANLITKMFQSSLDVDDFTKPAVDCFVEAMYTGGVDKLAKDIFEDVNKMAHVFNVSWLTKRCLKFYKSDVLKFENNSYEEILFACEIASRAHYNLKQSKFVSCFVKNVTFKDIGKSFFLQKYMANFAEIPKRRLDMSLAIAGNEQNIIGNCLTSYLSLALGCKKLNENSLYLLRKLDFHKYRDTFPSQFKELTSFLADISEESDCAELKKIVKHAFEQNSAGSSGSSEESKDEEIEDFEDDDCEDFKDVANQTADIEFATVTTWCEHKGKYLKGYSSGNHRYSTLDQAQSECLTRTDCGGITYEPKSGKYTLRKGPTLLTSPSNEISWKRCSETIEE